MIQNLIANWKTTSAGLTLICGAIVHIVFLARSKNPITETDVMLAIGAVLGGVGMLSAGDASKSKQDAKDLQDKVDKTAAAVITGDTSILEK